jgi:hypothetical protein
MLELFRHTSRLHNNFAKCSVLPIAYPEEVAIATAGVMECQLVPYPVKYLGIRLAMRRLPSKENKPLVDRIVDKLPTWRVAMMRKVGRLALIKSVLVAILLH